MIPLKTYDLDKVLGTLGGYRIGGHGETGAFEFEMASDIGDHSVSADGQVTFSRNNDKRVILTITVMETSVSYKDLGVLMKAQQLQSPIEPLVFFMQDSINGDEVEEQYATFLTRPGPSKGKKVGERQFKLLLPNAADMIAWGAKIVV